MKRLPHLLRSTLTVLAGLLLAGTLAVPAAAEQFEHASASFELQDVGEDHCTFFNTAGAAAWPSADEPARASVDVEGTGWISHAPPETICLSVEPFPRHIAFTAYVDREPVAWHSEPFERDVDDGGPFGRFTYEFSLTAPNDAPIDYLTVELCHTRLDDIGQGVECGLPVAVEPGGTETGERS